MPRPKSEDKLVPVMVRLPSAEVERIDAERADRSRSDYVRSVLTTSSGGAGVQPPAGPTGEAPTSPPSAPPDPITTTVVTITEPITVTPVRPPSDRQLAARVFAAMRDIDPTDAALVGTADEATFGPQWMERFLDAWKAVYAPPAPAEKPQRRQGTISRPAGRPKVVDLMEALEDSLAAAKKPTAKRHALDCSCLGCKPVKAATK